MVAQTASIAFTFSAPTQSKSASRAISLSVITSTASKFRMPRIYVSPMKRAREIALTLGLAHTSFLAHGIATEIYAVDATTIRARTTLEVDPTVHLFHVIPIEVSPQSSHIDWHATLIDAQTIRIKAYQVLWAQGKPMFSATWHGYFWRIFDKS